MVGGRFRLGYGYVAVVESGSGFLISFLVYVSISLRWKQARVIRLLIMDLGLLIKLHL